MNIINSYTSFVTQLKPSRPWKLARFLLHWLTIPLKLGAILTITLIMQVYLLVQKKRKLEEPSSSTLVRKLHFKNMLFNLPVYENQYLKLYVNRVPFDQTPDGRNHNDDHQGARHGTYAFIMSKLGLLNDKINNATRLHLQKQFGVCRGFKYDVANNLVYNSVDTSGDQLLGLCLAVQTSDDDNVRDAYEEAILGIIENDYALRSEDGKKKSNRAMWQPGLETVGAQALTILAALSVGAKLGNPEAKTHYNNLIWRYGYGLLSLFPTTFVPQQRGYFNDHNCMVASYLLAKNSKSKYGKLYWSLVMLYTWSLSYNWYNGYFTGLLNEIQPTWLSKKYLEQCKTYLFEEEPINYSSDGAVEIKKNLGGYPIKLSEMNQGEFLVDEEQTAIVPNTGIKHKSGLGWVAAATLIDLEESKESIK